MMRNISIWGVVFLVVGMLPFNLYGGSFNPPQITTFYKHQYQASNRNWSISHAKDGFVYVGNDEGLLSYDGVNWILNPMPDHSRVRSVLVSNNGLIYTGSSEEFGYWKRDQRGDLHYTSLKSKLVGLTFHNQSIWRIFENDKNEIIFQAFSLVLKYDGEKVVPVETELNPSLMFEYKGDLFGGDRKGNLLELTRYGFSQVLQSDYLKRTIVKSILPYKNNHTLIATSNKGFFICENNVLKPWESEANTAIAGEGINCALSKNGLYYIGTINSGIYVVNPEGKILYQINSGNHLQDNTILSMKFDAHDRLWFSMSVGFGYAELNNPLNFIIDHSRRIGAVHDVAWYNNRLYIATNKGVFYTEYYKGKALTSFNDFKSIPVLNGLVWSLKVIDNQLLCGHSKGTFLLANHKIQKISTIAGGRSYQVIMVKNEPYVIQNTYTELVVFTKDENKQWAFKTIVNGFSEPTVELALDHKSQIWLQHDRKSELYSLKLQSNLKDAYSYNVYNHEHGLPLDMNSQLSNFNNRIVITSSQGIYTYDHLLDSIVFYTELNQQLSDFKVSSKIIRQGESSYWFIKDTHIALFQFKGNQAHKLFEYSFNEPHIGLVEKQENIVSIDSIGTFICLENGIGFVDEAVINNADQISAGESFVVNTTFSFLNKKEEQEYVSILTDSTIVELPYKHYDASVNLATLATPGKKIQYTYLIKHNKEEVLHTSTHPTELFNRLKPGVTSVNVTVSDVWGRNIKRFTFFIMVDKPFYLKVQFLLLFAVVFILIMIVLYYRFTHNLETYIATNNVQKIQAERKLSREEEEHMKNLLQVKDELEGRVNIQSNHIATGALNNIRNKEVLTLLKKEISDQKEALGVRFPDKYYKKLVDLIDKNIHVEDDWKVFEQHFDEGNGNFFSRLKDDFPQLTPRDLRLCAYLKMNLSSKEIAPLLNISERSVEVHRYRLRKKMDLPSNINLSDFILAF